jgi:NAD-dependent SIR2 family protein deacetylase
MIEAESINSAVELLETVNHILIGAGAGLSAAAGLDYTDTKLFAELFPGLAQKGHRNFYSMFGYSDWSEAEKWGYLANQVNYVCFRPNPHPVYFRLLDLVKDKDYFVITSNVDEMFIRNGFDAKKIFTPQGVYSRMQCLTPCWRETWSSQPIIERILPEVDPETHTITDPDVIPYCPNCGGPVFFNIRGGDWFIEDPYQDQQAQWAEWVQSTVDGQLLVFEVGAGVKHPSDIRWPMEQIVYSHPSANLIRVNLQWPEVPKEIAEKSVLFPNGAMETITTMWEAIS